MAGGMICALMSVANPATGQLEPMEAEPLAAESGESSAASQTDAREHYERGIQLYKNGLYREAASAFNRALALDPGLEDARDFLQKCNAKINMTLAGEDPSETPEFETFDPESINPEDETAQLSADELKRQRVRQLLSDAQRYLEAGWCDVAEDIYGQVLLIDPKNRAAQDGAYDAALCEGQQDMDESRRGVELDRKDIRAYIEESKQLPEGAGPDGIKPYRFTVREIEEEFVAEEEVSPTEKLLEEPVSVEFEEIHISEIITFIAESWDVNFVIDQRAVAPPAPEVPEGPGPGPGAGPGGPGAGPGGRGLPPRGAGGAPGRPTA